jgi:hypothetical protein
MRLVRTTQYFLHCMVRFVSTTVQPIANISAAVRVAMVKAKIIDQLLDLVFIQHTIHHSFKIINLMDKTKYK